MATVALSPPNAILFVLDRGSQSRCIAVGTKPYVDGETTVTLTTNESEVIEEELKQCFEGSIETLTGTLSVVTCELAEIVKVNLDESAKAEVRIFCDDKRSPSRLVIYARPAWLRE